MAPQVPIQQYFAARHLVNKITSAGSRRSGVIGPMGMAPVMFIPGAESGRYLPGVCFIVNLTPSAPMLRWIASPASNGSLIDVQDRLQPTGGEFQRRASWSRLLPW